jgi:5-methylcytosine-specific restriction endonuclease McrA
MCKKQANLARHPEKAAAEYIRRAARAKGLTVEQYHHLHKRHKISDRLPRVRKARKVCPLISSDRRLYYLVNAEKIKAKARAYHAANPIKSRERRHRRRARFNEVFRDLTDVQWREIVLRFGGRCAYCDRKTKLTIDHITPIIELGAHTASNVVPACHKCNTRKRIGPPLRPVQPMLLC